MDSYSVEQAVGTTDKGDCTQLNALMTKHGTNVIFFFNDTATTEIYTLSLHDALPISQSHYRLKDRICSGYCHRNSLVIQILGMRKEPR